jgi:hypothetical protein
MRSSFLLGAALVLATGASAVAESRADRGLRYVATHLDQADHMLDRARGYDRPAARLEALDRAITLARLAESGAARWSGDAALRLRREADATLVRALVGESEIYFQRKSLDLAKKRAVEAVERDPANARAANLLVMIDAAAAADPLVTYQGVAASSRILARREAMGMPLRPRGNVGRR